MCDVLRATQTRFGIKYFLRNVYNICSDRSLALWKKTLIDTDQK